MTAATSRAWNSIGWKAASRPPSPIGDAFAQKVRDMPLRCHGFVACGRVAVVPVPAVAVVPPVSGRRPLRRRKAVRDGFPAPAGPSRRIAGGPHRPATRRNDTLATAASTQGPDPDMVDASVSRRSPTTAPPSMTFRSPMCRSRVRGRRATSIGRSPHAAGSEGSSATMEASSPAPLAASEDARAAGRIRCDWCRRLR